MVDKWSSLVERKCLSCNSQFTVQYQSTLRRNGGLYCSRKCNPDHNKHLIKYVRNPLGSTKTTVEVPCCGCGKKFSTKVKNINRNGGKYCSRACNPAYAKKYDPSTKYRRYNLKAKYGMLESDYDEMLNKQGGVCAICGEKPKDQSYGRHAKLHIDHDHETGKVRELLCMSCNQALGFFRDEKSILENAIKYIDRHKK